MAAKLRSELLNVELGIECDYRKDPTEECGVRDVLKTYDSHGLCRLKKCLALYGGARQNTCTDLCEGAWELEGGTEVRNLHNGGYGSKCPSTDTDVFQRSTRALEVLRTSPPLASSVGTPLLCKGVRQCNGLDSATVTFHKISFAVL